MAEEDTSPQTVLERGRMHWCVLLPVLMSSSPARVLQCPGKRVGQLRTYTSLIYHRTGGRIGISETACVGLSSFGNAGWSSDSAMSTWPSSLLPVNIPDFSCGPRTELLRSWLLQTESSSASHSLREKQCLDFCPYFQDCFCSCRQNA